MTNRFKILVNGQSCETEARTLDELCVTLGFGGQKIATARNGDFVPRQQRGATLLQDNDRIEIVSPRQGG